MNGGRFDWFAVDMSSSVLPGVCRIISLNLSMFSSGYDSSVVLFIVCILRIYHISPSGILFVFIVIAAPIISHVPMSSGVSVTLCPIGESSLNMLRQPDASSCVTRYHQSSEFH